MSIALSEFWARLVRLGIADADRCRNFASSYSQSTGSPPTDAVSMAKFLIAAGNLTKFQAKAILSDDFKRIRHASFLQREADSPAPFSRWLTVAGIQNGPSGLLLRLKNDPTASLIVDSMTAQKPIQHTALQPIELVAARDRIAYVFSPLPAGQSLQELIESRALSPREVVSIAQSLCKSLTPFHQAGWVHQEVKADRVWMTQSGDAMLLRSPLSSPIELGPKQRLAANASAWLDDDDFSEFYLAPESTRHQCSPACDVYSLGCLLFRLALGRRPFDGADVATIRARHESDVPLELAEAVAQGESGDPLLRVLAFALAKNPQARFQDAIQMGRAIDAIAKTIAKPAPAPQPPAPQPPAPVAARESAPPPPPPATPPQPVAAKQPEPKPVAAKQPEPKQPEKKERPAVSKAQLAVADTNPSSTPDKQPPASKEPASKPLATKPAAKPTAKPAPGAASPAAAQPAAPAVAKQPAAKPLEPNPPAEAGPTAPLQPPPSAEPVAAKTPNENGAESASAEDGPGRAPGRRRRRKNSKAPLVLGGLGIAVLLLIIGLMVPKSQKQADSDTPRPRPEFRPPPPMTPIDKPATTATTVSASGYELVDNPKLLWAPPYPAESSPPSLAMLPPGPGAILSVRLSQLLSTASGKKLVDTMAPELTSLVDRVATRTKVSAEEIARCTVALHPGSDGNPKVSLAIELTTPEPLATLTARWGVAAAQTPDGETIYAGEEVGADAFYIAEFEEGKNVRHFSVGPLEQIQQVASIQGSPINLAPTLATLWKGASDTSELTGLFNPNFLLADARQMFDATAPGLRDPLRRLMIPSVSAVMVSATFDDSRVYLESRMSASGGTSQPMLMNSLQSAFEELPQWADDFIVSAVPDASWRLLANRLPSMLRFMVEQTRFGIDQDSVTLNAYLPASGLAQLSLASMLAMNTPAGAIPTANATAAAPNGAAMQPVTVDELLNREMSIAFDQESLQSAIIAIADEFNRSLPPGTEPPPFRIIGGDLEKMGITQNQQIRDFNKKKVPLRTVLTDLTFGANPDKTATSSHDPKQTLIWVVAEDPEANNKRSILITTREAAAGKYELPPEFKPQ